MPEYKIYYKNGKVLDLSSPKIMGILNVTPDSFSDGGRYTTVEKALMRVEQMLIEGADIIDIGGYSSRPGAEHISVDEELKRVIPKLEAIRKHFPNVIISVDTFRAKVAEEALNIGVEIINDISAFNLDNNLLPIIKKYKPIYILMHMQGTPQNMQVNPYYDDVVKEILNFFINKIKILNQNGIYDIILDPGFGFGKNEEHNKTLFNNIKLLKQLDFPILIGISRKSWLRKITKSDIYELLPIMGALHWNALQNGVNILRVHDIKETKQVITFWNYLRN